MNKYQMIIFIWIPASGKTSFYNQYFKNDYRHINLDTLKTRYQEDLAIKESLKNKNNLVIDNTNITKEERRKYITAGKENNYLIIGYYFKYFKQIFVEKEVDDEVWNKIPDNKKPLTKTVKRPKVQLVNLPIMKKVENKTGVYFNNEEPVFYNN